MNLFRSIFLKRKNFKLKLLKSKYDFIIWDRPGKWCETNELEKIRADLISVGQRSQEGKELPQYGIFSKDQSDIDHRNITIIYDKNSKEPVAFSAQLYLQCNIDENQLEVMHTGLTYIVPSHRGKGLMRFLFIYPMVILLFKSGLRPIWVSSLSQVPSVIGVVAESFDDVFPDPWMKNKQTPIHREMAYQVINCNRENFAIEEASIYNDELQIIQNSYALPSIQDLKKTYKEVKKHRDENVNNFCKERLDYNRGDDFLQIGKWTVEGLFRFARKNIPKTQMVQSAFNGFVTVFNFTIVPLFKLLVPKG